ncbi:hypothetical protein Tco_1215983 [Tanacetum coccineum]
MENGHHRTMKHYRALQKQKHTSVDKNRPTRASEVDERQREMVFTSRIIKLLIMPPKRTTTPMTNATIKQLIAQCVADAMAEYEANKSSRNGDDSHDLGSGRRRTEHTTRECTYSDFLKCQPLNFKGTEGVLGLTQWFEKMEYVFHISNCTVGN